jgi:hypothetical protein
MRALSTDSGVQSLRSITARSSSARVLDLHQLAIEAAENPDHRTRPMFAHPVLNRTIIVKYHPRPGDFDFRPDRRAVGTKVIFPFDAGDLDLGGQYLLVDEPDLVEQVYRQLDYAGIDMERDLAVLRVIDSLPTLDPFLLREALAINKFDVAPCYFRLSPADQTEMLAFVAHQVETLIDLCFSGPEAGVLAGKAERLSQLLLGDGDSPELEPLREAMRLEAGQFARSIFAWKALLYYRWRSRILAPELKETRRSIAGVDVSRFESHTAPFVSKTVAQLEAMIGECERRIAHMFKVYDDVFETLTVQRSPEPFRKLLADGPRLFARLGERMGRLEQVISYWRHQFPDRRTRQMPPDSVVEGLRNLLGALSIRPGGVGAGRHAAGAVWGNEAEPPAKLDSRRPVFRRAG